MVRCPKCGEQDNREKRIFQHANIVYACRNNHTWHRKRLDGEYESIMKFSVLGRRRALDIQRAWEFQGFETSPWYEKHKRDMDQDDLRLSEGRPSSSLKETSK